MQELIVDGAEGNDHFTVLSTNPTTHTTLVGDSGGDVFNIGNDDAKAMVAEKQKSAANQIIAPRLYIYPFWRGSDPRYSTAEGARQVEVGVGAACPGQRPPVGPSQK